ncbi:MAG: DedA family protein [Sphingomonadaceae bacterium]|uniref:YqaA family protein n=1 Tax=Thermaurantiacus sp. TaxID=2820283 RepID=UPI00298EDB87|nr:YqaA family protein [Thermaurantiacus sp.]MCS6986077.1 DedA family protein [Sphingomonadaceae bacterium]MDW8414707.1 YqaA family protein [Thermaurantiacus sp.]
MLKRLYHWTLDRCGHPQAERWLALLSFLEASVFPIPPDALLAPMCLAEPRRAFRYAAVCTLASVAGALLGYAIGLLAFETLGRAILALYGVEAEFQRAAAQFNAQGFWLVFLAGFTPIPFKVITIAAGATAMPLPVLVGASLVSRGARFFLVAGLLWRFGPPMKDLIDRHFALLTALFGVLLVGGFLALGRLV